MTRFDFHSALHSIAHRAAERAGELAEIGTVMIGQKELAAAERLSGGPNHKAGSVTAFGVAKWVVTWDFRGIVGNDSRQKAEPVSGMRLEAAVIFCVNPIKGLHLA